jgi:hypothetical protein
MEDTSQSIRIFSGTEVAVNLLKSELEKVGVSAMIQSDSNSGVSSGFYGGYPSDFELFISETDLKKVKPILKDFMKINE